MDARSQPRPALHRLAVDVERHRRVGLDRRALNPLDRAAGNPPDGAVEEARQLHQRSPPRSLFHHDEIEPPIVHLRARRDARAVAELRRVGDGHEDRAAFGRSARMRDAVQTRQVTSERAQADARVPEEPAPLIARRVELRGDVRVESDAGDVHEVAALDFADVHQSRFRGECVGDRQLRFQPHAELARQPVPRAGGNDAERHVVEDERRGHFVDRPVAAPRHHEPRASQHRRLGELARMPGPLRDHHVGEVAVRLDDGQRDLRPRARHVAASTAGNGIDDDGYRH